jgi:hypothetical protein
MADLFGGNTIYLCSGKHRENKTREYPEQDSFIEIRAAGSKPDRSKNRTAFLPVTGPAYSPNRYSKFRN